MFNITIITGKHIEKHFLGQLQGDRRKEEIRN